LYTNQIGDAGAVALADALKTNTSVTVITLGDNQIGDAGVVALANALKTNTTVIFIDLCNNGVRSDRKAILIEDAKVASRIIL
jgi:hypothetical protein